MAPIETLLLNDYVLHCVDPCHGVATRWQESQPIVAVVIIDCVCLAKATSGQDGVAPDKPVAVDHTTPVENVQVPAGAFSVEVTKARVRVKSGVADMLGEDAPAVCGHLVAVGASAGGEGRRGWRRGGGGGGEEEEWG